MKRRLDVKNLKEFLINKMTNKEKEIVRLYLTLLDDDVVSEIQKLDKNRELSEAFYKELSSFSEPSQAWYINYIFADNVAETLDSKKLKILILEDYCKKNHDN